MQISVENEQVKLSILEAVDNLICWFQTLGDV
jgi:hypothetical protein